MSSENLFKQLAVLTPSRITTAQRHGFASASIDSLRKCLNGVPVSHIVVHDSPTWKQVIPEPLRCLIRRLRWDKRSRDIYAASELTWVDRDDGRGSATAMLLAVELALAEGKSFGFIHLDDHVYCEGFGKLLAYALMAMENRPNLLWSRFSGYPLIYEGKVPIIPNDNDQIVIDGVTLSPCRYGEYTLWISPLTKEVNKGNYWPIAMWFSIYRLFFLKTLLEWAIAVGAKHLSHVETYYKNGGGFQKLLNAFPDEFFGYINMQFGGIEMHRNRNWGKLLCMPNDAIR